MVCHTNLVKVVRMERKERDGMPHQPCEGSKDTEGIHVLPGQVNQKSTSVNGAYL